MNTLLIYTKRLIPPLSEARHKGQAGRIAIIGGSEEFTGAPYFSGISTLKLGADLCYVFCDEKASIPIKSYSPDLMVFPYLSVGNNEKDSKNFDRICEILDRLHTLVIGPGLGKNPETMDLTENIITKAKELNINLVFDADGLHLVQKRPKIIEGYKNVILTPNLIEFERLCKEKGIDFDRDDKKNETPLKKLCQSYGNITIVCKGQDDLISDGDQVLRCSLTGSLRRCGGQGDLLSGAIATFMTWQHIYHKEHKITKIESIPTILLAAYGGCAVTRESSKLAFQKLGRSCGVSDMINQIHFAYENLFETLNTSVL